MKNLIKQKLLVRRKSPSWLAKKTGLRRESVSRLIHDKKRIPRITNAHKIAQALDSTIEEVWILE